MSTAAKSAPIPPSRQREKPGQTLKWIGEASRKEIGEILDRPAHLFLTVKVRENWADEREFYSGTGLDFDV